MFLVDIALIDTSWGRRAGWPVNPRGPVLSGEVSTVAAYILQPMKMPEPDLNNPSVIYQCYFL